VSEVVTVATDEIEPPPSFGGVPTDFLLGIGKAQGRVRMLLDIDHVLTDTEIRDTIEARDATSETIDASCPTGGGERPTDALPS